MSAIYYRQIKKLLTKMINTTLNAFAMSSVMSKLIGGTDID